MLKLMAEQCIKEYENGDMRHSAETDSNIELLRRFVQDQNK